jgi:hypothetical protein
MASLTVEDLITQAIQEGKIIQGVNDPETLKDLEEADRDIAEGRTHSHEEVRRLVDQWASK